MTSEWYVDNKKLYETIKAEKARFSQFRKEGKQVPEVSRYIAKSIMVICEGLSLKNSYRNYTYRDDMVSTAIMTCIRYWENFDCDKYDNPHAYFTFIASKAFHRFIKVEKKAQYVKYLSVEDMVVELDLNDENDTTYKKFLETYLTDQWKVKNSFERDLTKKKERATNRTTQKKDGIDVDGDDLRD